MPKAIADIKDFLNKTRRGDAKIIKIKKNGNETKFKIRCARLLYTFKVADKDKAAKIITSLPPTLKREEIKN